MAENTKIATQSDLGDLNFRLQQLGENLAYHSGGSLSIAHGIGMYPGLNPDANGNDLSKYTDSNGDIVGDYFVRFVVGGVSYFCPANATALEGKPQSDVIPNESPSETVGKNCWVTEFTPDLDPYINGLSEDYLIPHAELGHWETHRNITAISHTSTDTAGHVTGDDYVLIPVDGKIYQVIATSRFGGPIQVPTNVNITDSFYVKYDEHDEADANFTITVNPSGSKPITCAWWWKSDFNDWVEIVATGYNFCAVPGWNTGFYYTWLPASPNTVTIINPDIGDGRTEPLFIKCIVSNAGYSVESNICTITIKDLFDGSWIILETTKIRELTSTQLFRIHKLRAWAFKHYPEETKFYSGSTGKEMVKRMVAAGHDFNKVIPTVDYILSDNSYESRFSVFRQLVLDSIKKYWPDCPHPLLLKYKQCLLEGVTVHQEVYV